MRITALRRTGVALAGALAATMVLQSTQAMQPGHQQLAPLGSAAPHGSVATPQRGHTPPLPLAPAHGAVPGWLHTAGTQIVDARGHPVRMVAINWYGAEGGDFVPGGLDVRPYTSILRTIKYLGFNTIRIPISNELVERNPVVRAHLGANPWFRGWRALDILEAILTGARHVGLMVVLVDMRARAGITRAEWTHTSLLWYSPPQYTQRGWVADWLALARRYRDNPAVVGFDLYNEPHNDGPGLEILGMGYLNHGATWGPFQGRDNPATDWRLAAQQAGNAVLRVNPHVLIIVEGVEIYPYRNPLNGNFCPYHIPATNHYCADLYWWGGNLAGAKDYPVVLGVPHQLVYSAHEYGPRMHSQRWIHRGMTERDWQQAMYRHWGYLLDARGPNAAPVWIGEFGTFNYSPLGVYNPRGDTEGAWFSALIHYLQRHPSVGWSYWPINGTVPGLSNHGHAVTETYGLLTPDWAHLSSTKLFDALHSIMK